MNTRIVPVCPVPAVAGRGPSTKLIHPTPEKCRSGPGGADPGGSQPQEHLDTQCSVLSPSQPCGDPRTPQLDLHIAGIGEVQTERSEVKHPLRAGWGNGILSCEQRGLQRATSGWEDPFRGVEQEEGADPTMQNCKQGAVGRGHSCEGAPAAKPWAQGKGGWWAEMPRGAELSHARLAPHIQVSQWVCRNLPTLWLRLHHGTGKCQGCHAALEATGRRGSRKFCCEARSCSCSRGVRVVPRLCWGSWTLPGSLPLAPAACPVSR